MKNCFGKGPSARDARLHLLVHQARRVAPADVETLGLEDSRPERVDAHTGLSRFEFGGGVGGVGTLLVEFCWEMFVGFM